MKPIIKSIYSNLRKLLLDAIFIFIKKSSKFEGFTRQTLTLLVENTGFKVENFFPDMGTVNRRLKLVDQISRLIYYITRRFWGRAIQVEAKKYG